jgi:uncharacterized protein YecT (DUF1311 family)
LLWPNPRRENIGVHRNNVCAVLKAPLRFALVFLFLSDAARADDRAEFQAEDAQLNQTYGALRQRLDESSKSLLKSVQRSWVAFKEKDFALFSSLARVADPDRIYRYQIEETAGRTNALAALGQSERQNEGDDDFNVKTAREADQMLNNIYRECLRLLPSDKVQATKESEALWVEFRDLHCRLDATLRHGQSEDTVLLDLTKRRVIQFRHYMKVLLETELPTPQSDDSARDEPDDTPRGPPPVDPFRFAK